MNSNFSNKISFDDGTPFILGGYVSKQNCRIWDSKNPEVIEERPLHPEKFTVWSALCSEDVIGLSFFEKDDGTTDTVISERYGHMITDRFLLVVQEYDMYEYVVLTRRCHMLYNSSENGFIAKDIPDRAIFRRGNINWPP